MNRSGSVRNFARSSRHGKRDLTRGDAGPPPPARAAVAWEEDGRGCLFGNRGAVAGSRRPARVSSRPRLPSPQGLTARGLPFGTRVRRLPGCSHASARRSRASGERILPGCSRQCHRVGPERGPDGDGRHSCEPASRTVGRQRQAFGPGAGRRHVRCRIQTSRQGQRRAIIGTRPRRGDNRARGYRRRARPDQQCRLGQAKRRPNTDAKPRLVLGHR